MAFSTNQSDILGCFIAAEALNDSLRILISQEQSLLEKDDKTIRDLEAEIATLDSQSEELEPRVRDAEDLLYQEKLRRDAQKAVFDSQNVEIARLEKLLSNIHAEKKAVDKEVREIAGNSLSNFSPIDFLLLASRPAAIKSTEDKYLKQLKDKEIELASILSCEKQLKSLTSELKGLTENLTVTEKSLKDKEDSLKEQQSTVDDLLDQRKLLQENQDRNLQRIRLEQEHQQMGATREAQNCGIVRLEAKLNSKLAPIQIKNSQHNYGNASKKTTTALSHNFNTNAVVASHNLTHHSTESATQAVTSSVATWDLGIEDFFNSEL